MNRYDYDPLTAIPVDDEFCECGDVNETGGDFCSTCEYERSCEARELDFEDGNGSIDFADPGGTSALRAATLENPRNLPCPTCEAPDVLTPTDVRQGYQCDSCALRAEGGLEGY